MELSRYPTTLHALRYLPYITISGSPSNECPSLISHGRPWINAVRMSTTTIERKRERKKYRQKPSIGPPNASPVLSYLEGPHTHRSIRARRKNITLHDKIMSDKKITANDTQSTNPDPTSTSNLYPTSISTSTPLPPPKRQNLTQPHLALPSPPRHPLLDRRPHSYVPAPNPPVEFFGAETTDPG